MTDKNNDILLDVRDLRTYFYTQDGVVKAVDGVNFHVNQGEVVGLVGESGCGKSVTSFSILRLVGYPGKIVSGEIMFEGRDILKMKDEEVTALRGDRISMIFQQPTSCLNPVFDAGFQLGEVGEIHQAMTRKAGRERAIELLRMVGIPDPERRINSYPHELSGGMAQRVMIAMALACMPDLLIADEPTTASGCDHPGANPGLDAQPAPEYEHLHHPDHPRPGRGSRDGQRVATMYAGQIVEEAETRTLFKQPKHPYTVGLIGSIPVLGVVKDELDVIPGNVPNLVNLPVGCRFAPRCRARVEHHLDICFQEDPQLLPVAPNHTVRCWLYQ